MPVLPMPAESKDAYACLLYDGPVRTVMLLCTLMMASLCRDDGPKPLPPHRKNRHLLLQILHRHLYLSIPEPLSSISWKAGSNPSSSDAMVFGTGAEGASGREEDDVGEEQQEAACRRNRSA